MSFILRTRDSVILIPIVRVPPRSIRFHRVRTGKSRPIGRWIRISQTIVPIGFWTSRCRPISSWTSGGRSIRTWKGRWRRWMCKGRMIVWWTGGGRTIGWRPYTTRRTFRGSSGRTWTINRWTRGSPTIELRCVESFSSNVLIKILLFF